MLSLCDGFRRIYPSTRVGILGLSGVRNPQECPRLDRIKEGLEGDLRAAYPDKERLKAEPIMGLYKNYYKRFKSTYHVLNQVNSIAAKGRSIPQVAALVEAMFMAELKNMVLTSGHDLGYLKEPLAMDVAQGGESFTRLAGKEAAVKKGDIILRDGQGVAGSIIHGPDKRTMIRTGTVEAFFVAWGVPDLEEGLILDHLKDLEAYSRIVAPEAETFELRVL